MKPKTGTIANAVASTDNSENWRVYIGFDRSSSRFRRTREEDLLQSAVYENAKTDHTRDVFVMDFMTKYRLSAYQRNTMVMLDAAKA